jgi:hypothetical protein
MCVLDVQSWLLQSADFCRQTGARGVGHYDERQSAYVVDLAAGQATAGKADFICRDRDAKAPSLFYELDQWFPIVRQSRRDVGFR